MVVSVSVTFLVGEWVVFFCLILGLCDLLLLLLMFLRDVVGGVGG